MPATQTATCTICLSTLPLTPDNFYHRSNGWVDSRCQTCRRRIDRENRARRAAGNPVRARSSRKFGIEIEFCGATREEVAREMRALGLDVNIEGYNHQVRAGWKLVTDGSLADGYELVSPPLSGQPGREQVRLACRALSAAGASVDRSCGLHIHHEIADLNAVQIKRLIRGANRSQAATDNLVAPSRRNGQWAQRWTSRELNHFESLEDSVSGTRLRDHFSYGFDRYRALNFQAFPRYGTVEFRQHQGTVNAQKILAWLGFGQALVARAKDADADLDFGPTETARLLAQLGSYGLTAPQRDYLTRRAARLAPGAVTV